MLCLMGSVGDSTRWGVGERASEIGGPLRARARQDTTAQLYHIKSADVECVAPQSDSVNQLTPLSWGLAALLARHIAF